MASQQKFMVDINLMMNELLNYKIENLVSDPSGTGLAGGRFWFNTSSGTLKYFDGTNVQSLATGGNLQTAVTRAAIAGAANELMVSGGADRSAVTYSGSAGLIKVDANGIVSTAVAGTDYTSPSSSETLTNKTFDANGTGNSLSNVEVADMASSAVTSDLLSSATSSEFATADAIKLYVDNNIASVGTLVGAFAAKKTGTGTLDSSGSTVTGTGTLFTTELKAGDTILADGETRTINSITSDTELTLTSAFTTDLSNDTFEYSGIPTEGSGTSNAIMAGDYWRINVEGNISGIGYLEVGDVLVASLDGANDGSEFFALQANLTNAVTSDGSLVTANNIPIYSDTTGKAIKDSNVGIDASGNLLLPAGADVLIDGTSILDGVTESLVSVDASGNIDLPAGTEYRINGVNIIEIAVDKFTKSFNDTTDWVGASAPYTITILESEHSLGVNDNLDVTVLDSTGDQVVVNWNAATTGTVVLSSNAKFAGKVILMG